MANKEFGIGVFTCIFNEEVTKVLLLKRNKDKRDKYGIFWGNVGGKIEFGETSRAAAGREIKEEIGINVREDDLCFITFKEEPNKFLNFHAIFFFYGYSINENTKILLNDESEEYYWFNLDSLPEGISDDILYMSKVFKERNLAIK